MEDIGAELYAEIADDIEDRMRSETNRIRKKIDNGTATHADTERYALLLGKASSKALRAKITADALPDGTLYYNIARSTVEQTLVDNLARVNTIGAGIQTAMNQAAGIGLLSVAAKLNQDRVHDLTSNIANCDELSRARELLEEPIVNTTQSFADDFVKENAEAQSNAGLRPKIVRTADAGCCEWCEALAGTYDYDDVDDDVFRRHENCNCTVEFFPHDGRGIQNSHTKVWRPDPNDVRERKTYGL